MKAKTMYSPAAAGQRRHDASDVDISRGGTSLSHTRCQSQFIVREDEAAAYRYVYASARHRTVDSRRSLDKIGCDSAGEDFGYVVQNYFCD